MLRRWFGVLIVALLLVVRIAPSLRAQEVTSAEVKESIARGVEYLYEQQSKEKGNWYEHPGQPGGVTALVTMALLSSGEDLKDPRVQRALVFLRSLDKPAKDSMVYAVSLQTMAFCAAEPDKDRALITHNVRWLESTQLKSGERRGSWGYSTRQGNGDNSNTQFALLALHEAERAGVKVNNQTWLLAQRYWLESQKVDGSWGYFESQASTGSMTAAGVASLQFCREALGSSRVIVFEEKLRCCGSDLADDGETSPEKAVTKGLAWLGDHFAVTYNPTAGASGRNAVSLVWRLYYLNGLERAARMSGQRIFVQSNLEGAATSHDWYREAAADLIQMQSPEGKGSWKGTGHAESNEVIGTSLALLFLCKGQRPVAISRLRIGSDSNSHPLALANLTRRIERDWKRDLVWQTYDLRAENLQKLEGEALAKAKRQQVLDMLHSPVLFFSGSEDFKLTEIEVENLRRYLAGGGFLFVEACDGNGCHGKAFDAAFRREIVRVLPDGKLRELPKEHAIWKAQQEVDPTALPKGAVVHGIDLGERTRVVYSPRSLSCYWELAGLRKVEHPEKIARQTEAALRLGVNVVTYATDRKLIEKLDERKLADE